MLVDKLQDMILGIFEPRPLIPEREIEIPHPPDDFWKWFEKNTTPHPDILLPGGLEQATKGLSPIIGVREPDHFELYRDRPGNSPATLYINHSYIPLIELHGTIEASPAGSRLRYSFYGVTFVKWLMRFLILVFGGLWIGAIESLRHPQIGAFGLLFSTIIPLCFGVILSIWIVQSRSERNELESFLMETQK